MFSKFLLVKFVICFLLLNDGLSWRRRRRRRRTPPPKDCVMSPWSSWGSCSKNCDTGTRTRHRTVSSYPQYGGAGCSSLTSTDGCGASNGGCSHFCRAADGVCSCSNGYTLLADKKACGDTNECSGQSPCINSNCKNTPPGSYTCECLPGYKTTTKNQCSPKSCEPLTFQKCPAGAYRDEFGATCLQVLASCPQGREFLETCTLTCPTNYMPATIAQPSQGKQFAEDFTSVDFDAPYDIFTCFGDAHAVKVTWDWISEKDSYYCRRKNDPPMNIKISNTAIREREPFFTTIGTFTASDPQNDTLMFTIENAEGNDHFLIQGNRLSVKIVISWKFSATKDLNTYIVVVNATDNGGPPMHSQTSFNVTVLNINDPPHHLELSNNAVSENVPNGTVVGNLSALDTDIGPQRSSNFSWELVDSDNGFFSILGNQVLVAKPLNHEHTDVHRIQVRCSDFGEPRETSLIATLLVNVRNENDSPKSVHLTNAKVEENSQFGTVVGQVVAMDEDNDTLSFDLNGTDREVLAKFKLRGPTVCRTKPDAVTGKAVQTCSIDLVVVGPLDFERKNEYMIWTSVSDPGGITRKKFKIGIDDVNERPTGIILTGNQVSENSPGGTIVGGFVVSDPDNKKDRLERHTCSLENSDTGDEDTFLISQTSNSNVLQVKTNKVLDFEKKATYNINVTCKDSKLSLTKSFRIVVTDVNEKPTSLHLSSNVVQENPADFTLIGNLSAEDPEGVHQSFVYTVLSSSAGNFFIGGATQDQLLVNGSIDFETTETIDVNIRVSDSRGLHFEKNFIINVQDINDPPTGIILEANSFLPENSGDHVFIGGISIVDEDRNTMPSCQLLNSSNDRVSLNKLSLLVGPTMTDYESLDPKLLKILVNCSDGNGASITQWLTVNVEDVNEPPTDLILTNSFVRENRNNSIVGIIKIVDPDINQRHDCRIFKNLAQNESLFYIDASTSPPVLRTAKPLNFESSSHHYVDIICEDNVGNKNQPRHEKEKLFKIDVIDVNETPTIDCGTSFHVLTSSSNGSVIGQIQGYDADNEVYYRSKKRKQRKQLLSYRLEPENNSWPFDITSDGVIYLEGAINKDDYKKSIKFGVFVEDDGTLREQVNGSDIKKDERKTSVHQCQVVVISNATDKDIALSSNHVYENATNGTTIGKLSRKTLNETMSFHIIDFDDSPFVIDGDKLKVSSGQSLDYETLGPEKKLLLTVSSRGSNSGVFTKQFVIEIIDVNEKPENICLLPPQSIEDCTVLGHILIEDPDYPELQCGTAKSTGKRSEYNCHVERGRDTLSNQIMLDQKVYITKLTLHANKSVLTQGNISYSVPIVCRSTFQSLHVMSTTLQVTIPSHSSCHSIQCALCPQPIFCLHVDSGICVNKDNRIYSTVAIPVTYFKHKEFILKFQEYIKSLIENKSEGKTLEQLMQEFDDRNKVTSRRRRKRRLATPPFENVYVEVLQHDASDEKTSLVFAAAVEEQQQFELIPAAMACELLQNSEVKCTSQNVSPDSNVGSKNSAKKGITIGATVGGLMLFVIIIVIAIVWKRRRKKNSDNTGTVHFANGSDTPNFNSPPGNSMYETPVDPTSLQNQVVTLPRKDASPVLTEKRQDIKVFKNPMYRTPANPGGDSDDEREAEEKQRTFNHYEKPPEPIYETVDDDFYEKVEAKVKPRRSRQNPVYNMDEDSDDTLNPVVNLSASKIATNSENSYETPLPAEMSSFTTDDKQKIIEDSNENHGIANPIYTSNAREEHDSQQLPQSTARASGNVYQLTPPPLAGAAKKNAKEDDASNC